MFRVSVGLVSAFRTLGAILMVGGLAMIFAIPAVADDHGDPGGFTVPFFCENCTPQAYADCRHANGCYCFGLYTCRVNTPITCYCP